MNARVTISLDAMGGDRAPQIVVQGVGIALKRMPHVDFLLFGDRQQLEPLLDKFPAARAGCKICHTDRIVRADDKPSHVLRQGAGSSMWMAVDAVARGEAAGVVSAGNTGALMAVSKSILRMLPGIQRPAIASFFPTERGETVMLDLGANVDCDAANLVQFAVMGEVFARVLFGIERPTVGLLNVGAEEMKGHGAVRAAAAMLREINLPIKFHGFVEGNDLGKGTVDVVVTDGFTGNVALKAVEGTVKLYTRFMREAFASSWLARLGYLLARPAMLKVKLRTDPRRYNGAMFLGLNGIAVKSHGGTDAVGFANAIGVAVELVTSSFNERIKSELAAFGAMGEKPAQVAAS